ncbi:uncharacterized protein MELLADRAFT_73567 [Melampsora larici-populina 98AG31]|uniref:Uncharacterized protein n=1 Tax=Melampsora larici-populina (strain 98AG31 / pathotype 3-4-7) TaxID=747676 RepID=F4S9N4_MELLP|nr:uncharacterized protein MELLADRAFT_73567 [Melampsora larici-populina 98AG31]EGF98669.1 hypothetical protein MELLADRAFT_73567 [Melampsora larici-populina 98AG31]
MRYGWCVERRYRENNKKTPVTDICATSHNNMNQKGRKAQTNNPKKNDNTKKTKVQQPQHRFDVERYTF